MKNPVTQKNYNPRTIKTEHYKHNFARKFIRDYFKKHNGKCACCGQPIWKEHKKHKFCIMCSSMAKAINNRVHMQNKRDGRFKNISACIELSDKNYKPVVCDGNCFECIFSDCILPVDKD